MNKIILGLLTIFFVFLLDTTSAVPTTTFKGFTQSSLVAEDGPLGKCGRPVLDGGGGICCKYSLFHCICSRETNTNCNSEIAN